MCGSLVRTHTDRALLAFSSLIKVFIFNSLCDEGKIMFFIMAINTYINVYTKYTSLPEFVGNRFLMQGIHICMSSRACMCTYVHMFAHMSCTHVVDITYTPRKDV